MILRFTEYCNDDCVTDLDMVNESLSISDSAIKESEKVLDFIKNAINNGEVTEVSKTDQGRILRFVDNPVIKVYGCDCELDFTFFEFYGRPSTDDLKGKFGNANTNFRVSDNGGVTTVNFKITYDSVIIVNGSIHEFSRGIIAHELMHAYELYAKEIKGRKLQTEEESDFYEWIKELLTKEKRKDCYGLAYLYYMTDPKEIRAFSQAIQAGYSNLRSYFGLNYTVLPFNYCYANIKEFKILQWVKTQVKKIFNITTTRNPLPLGGG